GDAPAGTPADAPADTPAGEPADTPAGAPAAAAAGAPAASTVPTNRYPRRATVLMNCGALASSLSTCRNSDRACVGALSVTLAFGQSASSSCSLVTSVPA